MGKKKKKTVNGEFKYAVKLAKKKKKLVWLASIGLWHLQGQRGVYLAN